MSSDWSSCAANWTLPTSQYTDDYYRNYGVTILSNVLLMLGIVFLFWILRLWDLCRSSFDVRRSTQFFHDVNMVYGKGESLEFLPPGGWFWNLGLEMQRHMGLDGLVTFRFAVLCLHFCLAYLVIALGLLVFYWTRPSSAWKHTLSMDALSQDRPDEVLVPIAAAYLMAIILLILLDHEYKNFIFLRKWFRCPLEDPDGHSQEELDRRDVIFRSVLLDRLAPEIRTDKDLLEFCHRMFEEDSIVSAKLCVDTTALRRSVTLYANLEKDLEALRCNGGLLGAFARFGPHRLHRRSRVLSHRWFRDPKEEIVEVSTSVKKLVQEHKSAGSVDAHPSQPLPHTISEPVGFRSSVGVVLGALWAALQGIFRTSRSGSTGFVTFKNCQLQTVALCVPWQQRQHGVESHRAPFPNDLIWHNIGIVSVEDQSRAVTSYAFTFLTVILWSSIATFIQAFSQIDRIASCLKLILPDFISSRWDIDSVRHFSWWQGLNHEISAVSLVLVLVVLPLFTRLWAEHYCHKKCRSQVSLYSFRRCFVFTFVTLYVTAFSGSLFNTALAGLINSPMEIAKTIATGLGSVDYYFMTYIVTKIGIRLGVYLLRLNVVFPWGLWRLVEYLCRSFAGDHERTEQLKMSGSLLQKPKPRLGGEFAETILVESPYYDWILVDLSVTLSLTLLYGVMSPQMVLVGFLFFLSYAAMIRYNFLYVYVQEYDSGGDFCFTLINFAYFSLATSLAMVHMHMAAVMSDWKSAKVSVPSTICAWIATFAIPLLIIVVVAVWIFQHNRFQRVCETLSLEQAMAYDKKHSSKYQSGSLEDLFEDPSVIAARRICGTR